MTANGVRLVFMRLGSIEVSLIQHVKTGGEKGSSELYNGSFAPTTVATFSHDEVAKHKNRREENCSKPVVVRCSIQGKSDHKLRIVALVSG